MQSPPEKAFVMLETEATDMAGSSFTSHMDSTFPDAAFSASSSEDDDSQVTQSEDDLYNGDSSKQLVLYDPAVSSNVGCVPPGPIQCRPSAGPRFFSRLMPSVGAFTVQCAHCFKWRLIPTKEKYEEIREHILENPFVCETAREWRPDISCDDPTDISQDGSRLWAIDKPNIAQPPPGWQRLLRIRGEGSTKFADIYYQAPTGKRLRSMVEVQKYLIEHPEYATEGISLSRFSFQIPKPLQDDYVRKRPARQRASHDNEVAESKIMFATHLEKAQLGNIFNFIRAARIDWTPGASLLFWEIFSVNPLAWAVPDDTEVQPGHLVLPPPSADASVSDSPNWPARQARRTSPE